MWPREVTLNKLASSQLIKVRTIARVSQDDKNEEFHVSTALWMDRDGCEGIYHREGSQAPWRGPPVFITEPLLHAGA